MKEISLSFSKLVKFKDRLIECFKFGRALEKIEEIVADSLHQDLEGT